MFAFAFPVEQIILLGAVLLMMGIASSKFASRLGLPVLVLFLGVGMLAGSEGPGHIAFDNIPLAHGIGTLALAIILFDGGLRTSVSSVRLVWKPAGLLATLGVLITAVLTGLAAAWVLDLPLLHGLLLGSIVGSTDAAAVFLVLRSKGVRLKERLASLLEVESASNDPMAIFLTVGLIEVLLNKTELGLGLLVLFLKQMGIGAVMGLLIGRLAAAVTNRINLEAAGLYPILVWASGMLAFGLTAGLGGSGFLAVYIAGIVLGGSRLVFRSGTLVFHDGMAWMGQIAMFVVLGMLSYPSKLVAVAWQGTMVALVLMLVARPVSVWLLLLPFRFSWRESVFLSWTGLKGAVPVILGTYPLIYGLEGGQLFFNVVFFVVLLSTIVQGWSLPWVARLLRLQQPPMPRAPVSLEITSLRDVDGDIVEYSVGPKSRAAGHSPRDLALPEGVVIAMITRGAAIIPPRGSTQIKAGDHIFVVLRQKTRMLVDRAFSDRDDPGPAFPSSFEFPVRGSVKLKELEAFYNIQSSGPPEATLEDLLRAKLHANIELGASVTVDDLTLRVRELESGRITMVDVMIESEPDPEDLPQI